MNQLKEKKKKNNNKKKHIKVQVLLSLHFAKSQHETINMWRINKVTANKKLQKNQI